MSGIQGNLFCFLVFDLEFFFQIEREGKASLYPLTHFLRFFPFLVRELDVCVSLGLVGGEGAVSALSPPFPFPILLRNKSFSLSSFSSFFDRRPLEWNSWENIFVSRGQESLDGIKDVRTHTVGCKKLS